MTTKTKEEYEVELDNVRRDFLIIEKSLGIVLQYLEDENISWSLDQAELLLGVTEHATKQLKRVRELEEEMIDDARFA